MAELTPAVAPKPAVWVDRRHPDYELYAPHWDFLRQAYVGGPEYLQRNLFTFMRERPEDFEKRQQRAHHYNLARKVTDIISGYLWEQPPSRKRDELPEPLQAFWDDADREGHTIDAVMSQKVTPWVCVYGRVWIVVDKPKVTVATRGQELRERVFPYLAVIPPMDVLDARWAQGQLEWILLREWLRDDEDPKTSSGVVRAQYRLWTKTEWELWEVDESEDRGTVTRTARLVDSGTHDLGEVPVVPVDFKAATSWAVSPSLIWEIAYLDRSIFNHISLLDENLYDTTFSQIRIPWQGLPPGTGADEQKERDAATAAAIVMSTKRAFTYDGTSGTPPEWMAPPSTPADVLMKRIKDEVDELFRHVSLAGEMAEAVSEASGRSKEHEFRKLNKLLASLADNHESAEIRILRLAAKWQGVDASTLPEDAIDYPESFDVKTMLEELDEIKAMVEASLPDVVVNEARKEVTRRRFSKLPQDELDALLEAIDEIASVPAVDLDRVPPRRQPEAEDDEDENDPGEDEGE